MAMTKTAKTKSGNTAVEKLLPWYATGKLAASDRNDVENALKRSPQLRKQLDLIRQELSETVAANEALALPHADATGKFMAMIQREAKPRVAAVKRFEEFLGWLGQQLAGPPRWAVAAALLAIVVQSALLGALVIERPEGGYHTASGGSGSLPDGTLVLARFADGATLAELGAQLAALDIAIVDGPKGGGLFTLRIGPEGMVAAERDGKITALRAETSLVIFVGPVQ
jgi:hypothetical protein